MTTEDAGADGTLEVRRLIAAHLPDVGGAQAVRIGSGSDHVAYLVDERLIVRIAKEPDAGRRAAQVEHEARLLAALAALSPLPVPQPTTVAARDGLLAYPRLPGIVLLDVPHGRRAPPTPGIAAQLGRLLGALHAAAPEAIAGLVVRDDTPPRAWLDEAAAHYATVIDAIPRPHRPAIERFLGAPALAPPARLAFSHNDLDIEHVLVDTRTWTVSGILDWADAALVDPARDFGLICRDLGPAAVAAALAAHGSRPDDAGELRRRAGFYARCAVLEDLLFGLERDDRRYVDKSVTALGWLFPV
jgi:aminoglycoside phosphotransferase (APT) family kinase protein